MLMQASNQTLIDDYLTAVREATRSLPRGQQETIVEDLESHIEQALPSEPGEAEVRTVLDRLGSPESIAAEAGAQAGTVAGGPARIKEIIGLIGISIGSLFIPIVGWIVGIVLVWMSPVWSKVQKASATLIWPGGWFAMLYLPLVTVRSSSLSTELGSNAAMQLLGAFLFIAAPLGVLAWLIRSLVRADAK